MLSPSEKQELDLLKQSGPERSPQNMTSLSESERQELALLKGAQYSDDESGILSSIGDGFATAGKAIDSYTGAPTRAAIGAIQTGNNPLYAFADQFGQDPSQAPTGKEIAQVAGLSSETKNIKKDPHRVAYENKINSLNRPTNESVETYSPAGVAGLAVDLVADPLNFIPIGAAVKLAGKGAKTVVKGAASLALKGSVAALEATEKGSQAVNVARKSSHYIDNVIESVKGYYNPKVAADFNDFKTIAQKHNIDPSILPETVEFGPNSTIANKSKAVAEAPGGDAIQKRYLKAQGAVEGALDSHIASVGGGARYSDVEAGSSLLNSYNEGIKKFFDQDMLTHTKVINENPALVLNQDALKSIKSKITGIKNKAIGISRRGTSAQMAEARNFLSGDASILERSLSKDGNLSYKRAAELLHNIGEEAFKKPLPGQGIPANQKSLQDLYFTTRDAMYETAGHVMGQEAATEMAMNNQIISQFLKEKGKIKKIFEGDLAPEKLFQKIANSGDTNQINAIKEILSPEDFAKFKGAYMDHIVSVGNNGPLYKTTIKNLGKRKSALDAIFQPEEIDEFTDLLRLGDRVGDYTLNTSRTNTASLLKPKEFLDNVASSGINQLELEQLKEVARGKANAINVPYSKGKQKINPGQAKSILKQIPLIESKARQTLSSGRLASINETNKELERRKRAISGSE